MAKTWQHAPEPNVWTTRDRLPQQMVPGRVAVKQPLHMENPGLDTKNGAIDVVDPNDGAHLTKVEGCWIGVPMRVKTIVKPCKTSSE